MMTNDLVKEVVLKLSIYVPPRGTQKEHDALAMDLIAIVVEKAAKVVERGVHPIRRDIAAAIRALAKTGDDDEQAG